MKGHKIIDIIFAFAVFAAFITCFALIYSAIELFNYDTVVKVYASYKNIYDDIQKPMAIFLITGAVFGVVGSVDALFAYSVKNKNIKIILSGVALAVLVVFIVLISLAVSHWHSFLAEDAELTSSAHIDYVKGLFPIRITDSYAPHFTLYSLTMSSLITPFAMFLVIVCILGYMLFGVCRKEKNDNNEVAKVQADE